MDESVSPEAKGVLEKVMKGGSVSASGAVASASSPSPSPASVVSNPSVTSPATGGTPPSVPPSGSSGGGSGGGLWRRIADGGFSEVPKPIKIIGVLLLLYGWMIFSNHMAEGSRDSAQVSELKDIALQKKKLEIEAEKLDLETKKAEAGIRLKQLEKAAEKPAVQELATAHSFSCGSGDEGFQNANVQTFSSPVAIPQGCALVELTNRVIRIEGNDFSFAYPDKDNPGRWFSCGPDAQVKDCVQWLNTIRFDGRYEDKRVRAFVRGTLKVYQ